MMLVHLPKQVIFQLLTVKRPAKVVTAKVTVTASVKITQSLEKHSFLWFWDTVGGEWTTNSKKSSVSFTNYKSGLASGTYRVKSVFTVTTTSGQTETVTVYSAEKTIS